MGWFVFSPSLATRAEVNILPQFRFPWQHPNSFSPMYIRCNLSVWSHKRRENSFCCVEGGAVSFQQNTLPSPSYLGLHPAIIHVQISAHCFKFMLSHAVVAAQLRSSNLLHNLFIPAKRLSVCLYPRKQQQSHHWNTSATYAYGIGRSVSSLSHYIVMALSLWREILKNMEG